MLGFTTRAPTVVVEIRKRSILTDLKRVYTTNSWRKEKVFTVYVRCSYTLRPVNDATEGSTQEAHMGACFLEK